MKSIKTCNIYRNLIVLQRFTSYETEPVYTVVDWVLPFHGLENILSYPQILGSENSLFYKNILEPLQPEISPKMFDVKKYQNKFIRNDEELLKNPNSKLVLDLAHFLWVNKNLKIFNASVEGPFSEDSFTIVLLYCEFNSNQLSKGDQDFLEKLNEEEIRFL